MVAILPWVQKMEISKFGKVSYCELYTVFVSIFILFLQQSQIHQKLDYLYCT